MYDGMTRPTLIGKEEKPQPHAERTAKARKNAGLDTIDQTRGVNRKQDEVIVSDDCDNDIDGNLVRGVFVKEDLVDRFSVSG